jgi:hypothetical protein
VIPGAIRYVARPYTLGRYEYIGIYDRERASWPALTGGLMVPQSFPTEVDAQAWADTHLNPPGATVAPPTRRAATRKRAS